MVFKNDHRIIDIRKSGASIPKEAELKRKGFSRHTFHAIGDTQKNDSNPFNCNCLGYDFLAAINRELIQYFRNNYDMNLDCNSLDDEMWINNNGKINLIPR